jgi:phospholipase C
VVPNYHNSDHPGNKSDTGPSWVASVVNAIGKSPAWRSTAIVIVWDDWGGLYDHLAPPFKDDQGGLGLRVPAIVVSPFAKRGYVTHRVYEFGSIVRLIEDNWNLGRLGTTDQRSASLLTDAFDFAQKARPYSSLTPRYSQKYLERQPDADHAVDDE